MTLSAPRAALLFTLLTGLGLACSSGGGHPSTKPQPAAAPDVTANDVEHQAGQSIESILQSKVPGVLITRTADGGIAINMRGNASFSGSGEPLYVIDGIPVRPGPGGALLGVSPYDIETIKVLKDPSETAIYGMRGGNGVILITTKRPGKKGT